MIDMVFLLLLFFMTVSRFGGNEGMLPAHCPRKDGGRLDGDPANADSRTVRAGGTARPMSAA